MVGPLAERRGSELVIQDPGLPCIAEVDPRRVERILRNLVVNAVEHGDGHPVTVSFGVNETAVAVAVRDHGVGLRPGEAGLVFNRCDLAVEVREFVQLTATVAEHIARAIEWSRHHPRSAGKRALQDREQRQEREYAFCGPGCLERFAKDPKRYIAKVERWLAA